MNVKQALSGTMIFAGTVVLLSGCAGHHTGKLDDKLKAKATISGPGITGEAHLYQEYEGRVRIKMTVQGTADSKLTPGLHAVHIHETGACESFTAAKGHYDGNVDPQINPEANVSPGLRKPSLSSRRFAESRGGRKPQGNPLYHHESGNPGPWFVHALRCGRQCVHRPRR